MLEAAIKPVQPVQIESVGQLPQNGVIFDSKRPAESAAQASTVPLLIAGPDQGIPVGKGRLRQIVRADINLQNLGRPGGLGYGLNPEHVARAHKIMMEAINDGILPRNKGSRRELLNALRGSVDHWIIFDKPSNVGYVTHA